MELTHCIIEGDALSIVQYIQGPDINIPRKICSVILDIRALVFAFVDVKFAFVPWNLNSVAHEMARFALHNSVSDWWWLPTPPTCILNSLQADALSA
ncbi:hypothetical protein BVC80_1101g20 [Macleaya cordata]|uniref:RNase H type-1 domain-containing protein n=1 Tax=Macleaya cordata TaxID=56857 RepID=A0A200QCV5_MACCD|nr:hypothetical protein BVC80_1101g20 [Macleaya cordata]